MTAQSIVCGACAAEVPNGRLSCPSCGELLASVAGAHRATAPVAASIAASKAVPKTLFDVAATPTASVVNGQSLEAADGADDDDESSARTPQSATVPWGTAADLNGGRTPAYMPRPGRRPPAVEPPAAPPPDPLPADPEPTWLGDRPEPAEARGDESWLLTDPMPALFDSHPGALDGQEPETPSRPEREPLPEPDIDLLFPPVPSGRAEPGPQSVAQPAVSWPQAATEQPVSWPQAPAEPPVSWPEPGSVSWPTREPVAWPDPGVTLAPAAAAVSTPEDTLPVGPAVAAVAAASPSPAPQPFAGPGAYLPPAPVAVSAGLSAPAREWAGHTGAAEATEAQAAPVSHSMIDGDLRVRLLDFVRWLSVAGAAFAAVGFLLPWGQVVIGSADTGYFGRWGIAGPWHLLVALAILANLGLALIDNRVPIWIRTGIAGLGLGSLLLGLVWPYLTLPSLGAGPGAIIAALGAAALVVSGILALVADRHAEAARPV